MEGFDEGIRDLDVEMPPCAGNREWEKVGSMQQSGSQKKPKTITPVIRLTPAVWIMIAVLGVLAIVPFAAMALALKKSGYLPGRVSEHSVKTSGTPVPPTMDFSGLRGSAEKTAEKLLPIPQLADPVLDTKALQLGSQTKSQ